jgi:hypothetical protein
VTAHGLLRLAELDEVVHVGVETVGTGVDDGDVDPGAGDALAAERRKAVVPVRGLPRVPGARDPGRVLHLDLVPLVRPDAGDVRRAPQLGDLRRGESVGEVDRHGAQGDALDAHPPHRVEAGEGGRRYDG